MGKGFLFLAFFGNGGFFVKSSIFYAKTAIIDNQYQNIVVFCAFGVKTPCF